MLNDIPPEVMADNPTINWEALKLGVKSSLNEEEYANHLTRAIVAAGFPKPFADFLATDEPFMTLGQISRKYVYRFARELDENELLCVRFLDMDTEYAIVDKWVPTEPLYVDGRCVWTPDKNWYDRSLS
jgi:hypothetical protein